MRERNGANKTNSKLAKKITKIEPTTHRPTHGTAGIPKIAAFQITTNDLSNNISSV